ncbi:hypothetical protein SAMN05216349_10592 [Oribacterium sp. KHPX15]|nr:hypothetical protein SAMN05216349_10592 [Oribacterium sp. KHPX15]
MVLPALFALILIGLFINRKIQIRGLYGDDLYLWSYYGEENFWEFTFPMKTKGNFRPFYWALSYLEFVIVGRHVNYYALFNTVINIAVSFLIYFFSLGFTKTFKLKGKEMLAGQIVSFFTAAMYLGSHFAGYQIGQVLGLLETMALSLAISVLYLLYKFSEVGQSIYYNLACLCYFLVLFTHERFLALFPLFYLSLILTGLKGRSRETVSDVNLRDKYQIEKDQKLRRSGLDQRRISDYVLKAAIPLLEVIFFFGIRRIIAGQAMPVGTAGTKVSETFELSQAFMYALQQVQYIFGVNAGESYLSGINWSETPLWVHTLVYLSWIVLFAMMIYFIKESLKTKEPLYDILQNLLFISFIALCIGCSSITVRLEIRWIYVSYTAALLYVCYMFGKLAEAKTAKSGHSQAVDNPETHVDNRSRRRKTADFSSKGVICFAVMFILYCCLMIPVEQLYRSNFRNIFFFTELDRVNSLADQTIGKYQDFLGVRQTYIFYNKYGMTDFYGEYFYKPYDPEKTGQGSEVHFINDVSELPEYAAYENSVILLESTDQREYIDITDQIFGKADWDAVKEK